MPHIYSSHDDTPIYLFTFSIKRKTVSISLKKSINNSRLCDVTAEKIAIASLPRLKNAFHLFPACIEFNAFYDDFNNFYLRRQHMIDVAFDERKRAMEEVREGRHECLISQI